jgi:hypothetical protein
VQQLRGVERTSYERIKRSGNESDGKREREFANEKHILDQG